MGTCFGGDGLGHREKTDRFSTSPGAESTFWVPALVVMGWVAGRNRSIQHKSGRRYVWHLNVP